MPVISLTSDFGLHDHFVGVMHAVILGICPSARLVDLTHLVPRHDILAGAWQLAAAWSWFPPGSVHLAVVDPGVGSDRRTLAGQCGTHCFVAPDNGLLDLIFRSHPPDMLVSIDPDSVRRGPVSRSFHGRDIFAPAAALLAAGRPLTALGTPTSRWVPLAMPEMVVRDGCAQGHVVAVDGFGNCSTDIPNSLLTESVRIHCGSAVITGLSQSYASVPPGEPLALPGSHGALEIGINQGDAARSLGLRPGCAIRCEGLGRR